MTAKKEVLENQFSELKLQNDTLEKERQFYFEKLREIEYLLQARSATQGHPLGGEVLKILYASEDEKVTIEEETGALIITGADGTVTSSSAPVAESAVEVEAEVPANVEPAHEEEMLMEAEPMHENEVEDQVPDADLLGEEGDVAMDNE